MVFWWEGSFHTYSQFNFGLNQLITCFPFSLWSFSHVVSANYWYKVDHANVFIQLHTLNSKGVFQRVKFHFLLSLFIPLALTITFENQIKCAFFQLLLHPYRFHVHFKSILHNGSFVISPCRPLETVWPPPVFSCPQPAKVPSLQPTGPHQLPLMLCTERWLTDQWHFILQFHHLL